MEIKIIEKNIMRDEKGTLWVENCKVKDLAEKYGTPLYITSEEQIRCNYRTIRDAFTAAYPKSKVICAMKANNNMAIRRILSEEGAGGEAFGPGELWALLQSGANPEKCVLNGSYKEEYEVALAIENGVKINVDSIKELRDIQHVAEKIGKIAEIRIRLRLKVPEFDMIPAQAGGRTITERFANSKFGLAADQALEAAIFAKEAPNLNLTGYSFHLGRQSLNTDHFQFVLREMINVANMIYFETGIETKVLNMGGGLPVSERDPEGHGKFELVPPIDQYAKAYAEAIQKGVKNGLLKEEPILEIEPGRSIVGNSTLLVGKIMLHKQNEGHHWAILNCGGNQLSRIDSGGYFYHTIKAYHNDCDNEKTTVVDVVGNLCSADFISRNVEIKQPSEGDLLAVLDAGMYAETTASQFNGRPRPATVLVHGKTSAIIKQRETIRDIFSKQRIPARLKGITDKID